MKKYRAALKWWRIHDVPAVNRSFVFFFSHSSTVSSQGEGFLDMRNEDLFLKRHVLCSDDNLQMEKG